MSAVVRDMGANQRRFRSAWSEAKHDANFDRPLVCGYWMVRAHAKAPERPAMIQLCDHEPGNPDNKLDRPPYFVAMLGGIDCDPYEIVGMPYGREITEAEFRYQTADTQWRTQYASDSVPSARAVKWNDIPPIF